MSSLLQTPIDYLKGVGTNRADLLRTELDIHTFQDLLNFFPFRYIDKTKYYKINREDYTHKNCRAKTRKTFSGRFYR
jgi:ATP-dependent DNA helicase RecG